VPTSTAAGSDFLDGFASPALLQALAQSIRNIAPMPTRIAVAVSGGADSAMLAVHAAHWARLQSVDLHIFHIHHGLQTPADDWQARVHSLAQRLGLPCHSLRTLVDVEQGIGVEASARDARYAALAQLASMTGVSHVLLAHHQDDQAETVLLRLLRGSGPGGLGAMAPAMQRDGIVYLRPWLDQPRTIILDQALSFKELTGWHAVDDPSNADDRYTRSALRERLTPALTERWPGWQAILARHARQSAQAERVLQEVAGQDFMTLDPQDDGRSFSLLAWRELSLDRQALVLRHWLARQGMRMPTQARLDDWMRQLRGLHALGHDRQMQVKHGRIWIRCRKGRVFMDSPAA
jgi:tRNA(Ile)-lysidine synthase